MKQTALKRKPMKRSQLRRDWTAARAKLEAEGNACRICGQGPAEAAHVIGREHDKPPVCNLCLGGAFFPLRACDRCYGMGYEPTSTLRVHPDHIIPLCRRCHTAFDAHELDILPSLTREEQVEATRLVGLENARRRVCPSEYR